MTYYVSSETLNHTQSVSLPPTFECFRRPCGLMSGSQTTYKQSRSTDTCVLLSSYVCHVGGHRYHGKVEQRPQQVRQGNDNTWTSCHMKPKSQRTTSIPHNYNILHGPRLYVPDDRGSLAGVSCVPWENEH